MTNPSAVTAHGRSRAPAGARALPTGARTTAAACGRPPAPSDDRKLLAGAGIAGPLARAARGWSRHPAGYRALLAGAGIAGSLARAARGWSRHPADDRALLAGARTAGPFARAARGWSRHPADDRALLAGARTAGPFARAARGWSRHPARELAGARIPRGQASIEVLGLLPLVAVIALAAFTMIASHTAGEQAGEAAEAGALVLLQGGGDPRSAAEDALPEATRRRTTITVSDHRVHVRVRPRLALPIPGLADRLAGQAHADAGP